MVQPSAASSSSIDPSLSGTLTDNTGRSTTSPSATADGEGEDGSGSEEEMDDIELDLGEDKDETEIGEEEKLDVPS